MLGVCSIYSLLDYPLTTYFGIHNGDATKLFISTMAVGG